MPVKPSRRVVVLAAQVVVLTLATAPVIDGARAASDRASAQAAAEEQVSVRVTNGKLHATVRTDSGRAAAVAYASSTDAAEWTIVDESVATATEGGVAQLQIDLDDYENGEVAVAIVTASDDSFERDLRATETVEIVLIDGDVYDRSEVVWDKGDLAPTALKGQSLEVSLKGIAVIDAAKGIDVGYKAATEIPIDEFEGR